MTTRLRFALFAALASVAAVIVSGLIAASTLDSALSNAIDDRLTRVSGQVAEARGLAQACAIVSGSAGEPDRSVSIMTGATERCRSNPSAPSPRALGYEVGGATGRSSNKTVDGVLWRVLSSTRTDGAVVLVAERADSVERVRRTALAALLLASLGGAAVAAIVGALVAGPATRGIERLLARIRDVGRDPSGAARVGSVGGRDLDGAAAAFDSLLDELRAADAAQRRLFADAAHELRTPLTSVRTNAQLLERDPSLDGDARDMAGRIARQVEGVSRLVSGLVDHAAVGAWSRAGTRATDVRELARRAAERARERWPHAAIQVVDEAPEGGMVDVDAELVLRALGNLLDNAVVHGGGTARIVVQCDSLTVEDDGAGFDPSIVEHAFRPFTSSADSEGSGLGLAFVDHVARAHGGVASIEPGDAGGARVQLRLGSSG